MTQALQKQVARQSTAAGCRVLRVFSHVQITKDCTAKVIVELYSYAVLVLAVSAANVNLVFNVHRNYKAY